MACVGPKTKLKIEAWENYRQNGHETSLESRLEIKLGPVINKGMYPGGASSSAMFYIFYFSVFLFFFINFLSFEFSRKFLFQIFKIFVLRWVI